MEKFTMAQPSGITKMCMFLMMKIDIIIWITGYDFIKTYLTLLFIFGNYFDYFLGAYSFYRLLC